jgi:flagellar biosynthesis/type III secretory pathway M-ring protein FliF/YscJ
MHSHHHHHLPQTPLPAPVHDGVTAGELALVVMLILIAIVFLVFYRLTDTEEHRLRLDAARHLADAHADTAKAASIERELQHEVDQAIDLEITAAHERLKHLERMRDNAE